MYPTDDRYIGKIIDSNKSGTSQKFALIIKDEPSLKNNFFTLKAKISEVCDNTNTAPISSISSDLRTIGVSEENCLPIKTQSYIQVRIYEKSIQALLEESEYEYLEVGDKIIVDGNLKSIIKNDDKAVQENSKIDNESELIRKEKSYQNYLKKEKVFYEIAIKKIESIDRPSHIVVTRSLVRFRKSIEQKIKDSMPRPESDLAQGLVISGKGSMSEELLEDFKRVGLIHIVVLSGSNVSIISAALFAMLKGFSQPLKVGLGISSMIGFAIMTGAQPPVVRSVLMSSIPLIGGLFGARTSEKSSTVLFPEKDSPIILLFLTGLLMSLHNPMLPIYDISFQLSFMATLGLMVMTGPMTRVLPFLPEKFGFKEIVASSLATQIYVAPLLLTISDQMSIVFLVANIIVLPVLPLLMLFIGLIPFIGFIMPIMTEVVALVSWKLLTEIIRVVHYLAELPFATISLKIISMKTACMIWLVTTPVTFQIRYRVAEYDKESNLDRG